MAIRRSGGDSLNQAGCATTRETGLYPSQVEMSKKKPGGGGRQFFEKELAGKYLAFPIGERRQGWFAAG